MKILTEEEEEEVEEQQVQSRLLPALYALVVHLHLFYYSKTIAAAATTPACVSNYQCLANSNKRS